MLNIEKEREAFSNWHESEYGEHVTWCDDVPASHIHNDRWSGWKASALRAEEKLEGCVVVPRELSDSVDLKLTDYFNDISEGENYDAFVKLTEIDNKAIFKTMVEAARGGNESA